MASFEVTLTKTELAAEEWRAIPGWEGRYEVSSMGRIRSLPRRSGRYKDGRILKLWDINKHGYLTVTLCGDGRKFKSFYVARAIATAFHGEPPFAGAQVNHIDGCKQNNRATNLEWVTRRQNIDHSIALGLNARGERHGAAKLTTRDVRAIKHLWARGVDGRDLADAYGVTYNQIQAIGSGRLWRGSV